MGFKSYFRNKPGDPTPAAVSSEGSASVPYSENLQRPPPLMPATANIPSGLPSPSVPPTPSSAGPLSSSRSSAYIEDIKHEVMVNWLYQQLTARFWINAEGDASRPNSYFGSPASVEEGVLLKKSRNNYMACPPAVGRGVFAEAAAALNVQCATTINSRVVKTFLQWSPESFDVPLDNGLRIQIIPTMADLARARKYQFAAFIADVQLLVVWDDDPLNLMNRAVQIETALMALVWKIDRGEDVENKESKMLAPEIEEIVDVETGDVTYRERRPTNLLNTILVTVTIILVFCMLAAGYRQIAIETAVDGNYLRILFVLLTPVQIFFTLFFAQVIVGCLAQCFGPTSQLSTNSKYYSAKPPARLKMNGSLPHVTIQCPVYKEGLTSVIEPTIKSIKKAINTYELQGGTANIFINDDGLQLLSPEERDARIEFYQNHNIGWVARPGHNSKLKDGTTFQRRGKFKKASNMNFGLMISCKVEEKLAQIERDDSWTQAQEADAYQAALTEILEADGRAWADGNIRIGDYILLIDSDTRVPSDCLLDATTEMERSPEVGILQFSSGVMQVVNHYFENGITFFTDLIYTAIRYTVSNGDVAPFVGHNAILRWSAVQQVSYIDEDGYEKFWSESHVSEDFDMSLRLQCDGFTIRLAAWAGDGFKEGVSLTVYDELARWEKYAYGCNELLFHPIRFWIIRGPFTPLFRRFLFSNIRMTSKITIIAYIGTYYAIGAAWIMTTANFAAYGWFNGYLDKYYIDSWKVWFSIIIVFNLLGNVSLALIRYRTEQKSFLGSLFENFKWTLMLAVFLGGLSLHVSQALLAHMFEIDMTWGATSKEAEYSNFFIEVPKVLKKFKFSFLFSGGAISAMIILATASFVPDDWKITDFVAILPMATVAGSHMLLPIVLNPALMTFQW